MRSEWSLPFEKPAARQKRLFLIDGTGAVITTCMLLILVVFEPFFGMPRRILYFLMIPAGALAIYSITSYFLAGKNWRALLRGIAVANLLYCLCTAVLVVIFYEQLHFWGLVYFLSEMIIVVVLACIEWKVSVQASS